MIVFAQSKPIGFPPDLYAIQAIPTGEIIPRNGGSAMTRSDLLINDKPSFDARIFGISANSQYATFPWPIDIIPTIPLA